MAAPAPRPTIAAGRIASIVHATAGAMIASVTYAYDANGNRIEQREQNGAVTGGTEQLTTYQFDVSDRLVAFEAPDRKVAYTLDAVGNRLTEQVRTGSDVLMGDSTLSYNARDQLVERDDPVAGLHVELAWDANGNIRSQLDANGERSFSYDARDRLLTLAQPNAPPLTFDYQSDGLRLAKRQAGTETRYQYDQQSLIAETNAIGNTLARYHYGATQLASRTEAGTPPNHRHYLLDALDTPIALLTQQGAVSARTRYDAWGAILAQQSPGGTVITPDPDGANADLARTDQQAIGFTGYVKDDESGLYYAKARYYDPRIARFTTEDPERGDILQPPSLHRYLYAYANALVYIDPDGRAAYLSDWQAYTDDTVARYDVDIDRAVADRASGRAFALGVGRGLASLGNKVVSGLNTASNLLARELYDGATYEQAQREIAANELAMTDAMESAHHTALVIMEDPIGAARGVHAAAVGFAVDVAMDDPRAMAKLGEFTGQLVVPASTAKGLKAAGDTLGTVRAAMRMGDGLFDAGMLDEIEEVSRAAGRAADPAPVRINQFEGARREAETLAELWARYPNARIQSQVYLRTADGKWARDPLTGKARRLDFVVIENGRVVDVVETTSTSARKTEQFRREQRIRAEGGTLIRDRVDRCLLDACDVQTREDRRR